MKSILWSWSTDEFMTINFQSASVNVNIPLIPNHFLHCKAGGQFAPEALNEVGFDPCKSRSGTIISYML